MKKFKIIIMAIFISLSTLSIPQTTYANNTPFIKPALKITNKGIKFDRDNKEFDKAQDEKKAIDFMLEEYGLLLTFATGIVSFIMMGLFIINLMKLANSKGNPQERQKSVSALIFTGVGTALAGSATLITQLFYNFL